MKKLIFTICVLLLPSLCWSAVITSAQSGVSSAGSTWVGGVKPGAGDTAVIATGHTVTIDENTTLGANDSAVGHAITIQATDATTYGKVVVNSGVTLTLKGYNLTTASCMIVNRYAKFEPAGGSTISLDLAADNGSAILNNGHLTANSVTFGIPPANIKWDNAGTYSVTAVSVKWYDYDTSIWIHKIRTTALVDPGPVSNSAGNAVGTAGDSSLIINSQTNGPITEVATLAAITNTGDYWVDYKKGIIYCKGALALSVNYSFKYATWFGAGIHSAANTTGSSISITNCTLNNLGSTTPSTAEYTGAAIYANYKSVPALSVDRQVIINNNTFNLCFRPIEVYNVTTNASNFLVLTGNTFNDCRTGDTSFGGLFQTGYVAYLDINGNIFNSNASIHSAVNRGVGTNLIAYVRNNTGQILHDFLLPVAYVDASFEYNVLNGFGSLSNDRGFYTEGTSGHPALFQYNTMLRMNRIAYLGNYMHILNNHIMKACHHGIIYRGADGYITGSKVKFNRITDNLRPSEATDFPGGWSLGYNRVQWIDDSEISNNTFDNGVRSIKFSDSEGTIALGTQLSIYNNICSNSIQGIYRPTNTSTDITKMALSRLDYNNDYGNTTTPSNVKQGTFIKSSLEYHLNTRNIPGVYLHSPSYTLPQTGRDLVMTVAGTAGTDLSVTLAWGGGAPVELVAAQGTSTGGAAATTHTTPGTLIKIGSGWSTTFPTWHKVRQIKTISGTGANQHAMVKSNTADTLTVLPNNVAGTWTAPGADTVFVILESEVTLTDSIGGTVQAGIYSPDLVVAEGTYTDAAISIVSYGLAVDPQYSATFAPGNQALKSAGYGGVDIGAVAVQTQTRSTQRPSFSNFTGSFSF